MSKYKIINDPVHGFITIPNTMIFQLIEHPYFQRLRRISQMGMAHYVYPGTQHTRFHHALGAMYLMQKAIDILRKKQVEITETEENAALCAILLHDIGHGPYSHALEYVMTQGIDHEFFSRLIMSQLNKELGGQLDMAIAIFQDQYPKRFLHQLVSSQLDVDRLDYLARDSFFSGVYEGKISTERIISMLNVVDGQLVVEEKGLYSIEKYIISRRLMYWQVYLHKTALCAEEIQKSIIRRAKSLSMDGKISSSSMALNHFLKKNWQKNDFLSNPEHLEYYTKLDDSDVLFAIKEWQNHEDFTISTLCKNLINRKLFRIKMSDEPLSKSKLHLINKEILATYPIQNAEIEYWVLQGKVSNLPYSKGEEAIQILTKKGKVKNLLKISEQLNSKHLTKRKVKYFVCYPKFLTN